MAQAHGAESIYEMANTFRSRCLTEQRSLLWPEHDAWTAPNLDALWEAFIGNPDESKLSFMEKWKEQLRDQPLDVLRIATDVTALYYLFPANITPGTKRSGVREVLGWGLEHEGDPPEMPALDRAFDRGLGHAGTYYSTKRPWHVAYYLRFARRVLMGDADPYDLESTRRLANDVLTEVKGGLTARHILLHLLFPNDFERIASDSHKRQIVKAHWDLRGATPDLDVELLHIRHALAERFDRQDIDFYQPDVRQTWGQPDPNEPSGPVDDENLTADEVLLNPEKVNLNDFMSLLDVADQSHLDLANLQEINSLLLDKKQIIFEGPPGSGKTFLADLFARYFTENPLEGDHNEQIEVVQFHQSYGYEDFVQGIRPVTDGEGRLQYRVVPGIFLQHCERARANLDKRFVLIIDEINRGNLSRIFGELLMLLEYRDKKVRLPYASGDGAAEQSHLQIPPNLYLIGTMNSTDRSLAMIDYALRRRFFFYRLLPMVDGQATVLERWLAGQDFSSAQRDHVLTYFVRVNQEIGKQLSADFQIGHSYFMVPDIAEQAGLNRVWRRALRPLLEEYFHTARGVDAIIKALAPPSAPLPPPAPEAVDDPAHADDIDDTEA